jgi:glucose-1-phosphate cytidylyltransferase
MKVVILAGGMGTRISEETELKPKPMVEIGGKPILWHIMKAYSSYGFNDFVICLGYKGDVIKKYFADYHLHMSDLTIDVRENQLTFHKTYSEPWKITLVDTGLRTMTGGRLKRIKEYVDGDDMFLATYGDGVADVDLAALVAFHRSHGRLATLTAVQPYERFGILKLVGQDTVHSFVEKPQNVDAYVSGGFFALSPKVLDYIGDDGTVWERAPLERLAAEGDLKAFKHQGFWQCMDTLRDKILLEELWAKGDAPWKRWD